MCFFYLMFLKFVFHMWGNEINILFINMLQGLYAFCNILINKMLVSLFHVWETDFKNLKKKRSTMMSSNQILISSLYFYVCRFLSSVPEDPSIIFISCRFKINDVIAPELHKLIIWNIIIVVIRIINMHGI